jgi:septal ring factor EnvC (AmiA/AmiB activator)
VTGARAGGVALALAASLAAGGAVASPAREDARAALTDSLAARSDTLSHTESLLRDKTRVRTHRLEARTRALYKLSRAGLSRLWVDAAARAALVRRRAAARRVVARDARELELLREELASVRDARASLERAREHAAALSPPGPRTLARPVSGTIAAGFGDHRDGDTDVRLSRRGIELRAHRADPVAAVADGEVVYAGPIRGLGRGVIAVHGDFLSVTGRLEALAVRRGDPVARGDRLGRAAGDRVHLEIRLRAGAGGFPIDPAPLLAR